MNFFAELNGTLLGLNSSPSVDAPLAERTRALLAEPQLSKDFPMNATSWTPALGSCVIS